MSKSKVTSSKSTYALVRVPLAALVEDPNNPNEMPEDELHALTRNIERVGFLQPILVQPLPPGDGEPPSWAIVDGHHRARAAQAAGMSEVPAIVWDGSPEMREALGIGMNHLRGRLNLGAVAKSITKLHEDYGWSVADLTVTGYTSAEIEELFAAAQPQTTEEVLEGAMGGDEDDVPDEPAETRPYILELTFGSSEDLARAKRGLKKVLGKGHELGAALLKLLEEQE